MLEKINKIKERWNIEHQDLPLDFYYNNDFQVYLHYQIWSQGAIYINGVFNHDNQKIEFAKNKLIELIKNFIDDDQIYWTKINNIDHYIPISLELRQFVKQIRHDYGDIINND